MNCIFKVRIRLCHSYKYGANRTRNNEATRHNDLDVYEGNVSAHMRLVDKGGDGPDTVPPGQNRVSWEGRVNSQLHAGKRRSVGGGEKGRYLGCVK